MFVKDKNSMESFIHVCEGKTLKKMKELKRMEIRKHDITIFTFKYDANQKLDIDYMNFCPYCGIELEKDIEE